jgi:alkyl sulfatase BDS1-like metallo-beta-lactamase superfamily hydrolase
MINQGYVGSEIAELIELPPALEGAWHTRGYYGSVSHNVKAIYQRYLGWYEGNPARLWPHPPVEAGRRYVAAMGGIDAAVDVARRAFDDGDYRWAAEVLDRVLFTDEDHAEARELQARTFEQLAYGSENGTWRNAYLAGAQELRDGVFGTPVSASGLTSALTVEHVFASMAIRVDGPRVWSQRVRASWTFTDLGRAYLTELRNGTLIHHRVDEPVAADVTLRLTRHDLIGIATGQLDLTQAIADGVVGIDGDADRITQLLSAVAPVDPAFPIVTP